MFADTKTRAIEPPSEYLLKNPFQGSAEPFSDISTHEARDLSGKSGCHLTTARSVAMEWPLVNYAGLQEVAFEASKKQAQAK